MCRVSLTASRICSSPPPSLGNLLDELAADVRGHHDDGVLEIDRMALVVAQAAVVEHLQEDVEDVAMGLLDLVQEDDGVGPPADGLGQHAALFVADIARRGADQAAHGVPLHELAHVQADHGVLVVEHRLRQGLAQLGLAHAGGAEENERADGPIGVLQAGAVAADGVGHRLDGLVLVDHPLMDAIFHHQQLRPLGLHHAADGNAGPGADDLGDFLRADLLPQQPPAAGRRSWAGSPASSCWESCFRCTSRFVELLVVGFLDQHAGRLLLLDGGRELVELQLDFGQLAADLMDAAQPALLQFPLPAQVGQLAAQLGHFLLDFGPPLLGRALRSLRPVGGRPVRAAPAGAAPRRFRAARSPTPSPAGWRPRPSGRWPCRAGSGRRYSDARDWPPRPGPSP